MIKEWWNENWKKTVNYVVVFLAGVIITTAVILSVCNRRINSADSAAAALGHELTAARTEVTRSRETISELRRIQSELTEGIGAGRGELHDIIESLQSIRDKVSDMEKCLNNYYDNSRYYSNSILLTD